MPYRDSVSPEVFSLSLHYTTATALRLGLEHNITGEKLRSQPCSSHQNQKSEIPQYRYLSALSVITPGLISDLSHLKASVVKTKATRILRRRFRTVQVLRPHTYGTRVKRKRKSDLWQNSEVGACGG